MDSLEARRDDDHGVYEYGFEVEGVWIPVGVVPISTVQSHIDRVQGNTPKQPAEQPKGEG